MRQSPFQQIPSHLSLLFQQHLTSRAAITTIIWADTRRHKGSRRPSPYTTIQIFMAVSDNITTDLDGSLELFRVSLVVVVELSDVVLVPMIILLYMVPCLVA
ncbi:hypothetical protein SeMB42_g06959 [Synchytrium endobioticum]|uniref:Uncharacterized protein n=1 Tax=Synchytrium endobioticum TaxID=286115 RepID=A0A507CCE7_9FUNG|nr:hypothetical protein SeMB42_g06959 [Synchytrium endobioticum]